jgi:hypothetical protein
LRDFWVRPPEQQRAGHEENAPAVLPGQLLEVLGPRFRQTTTDDAPRPRILITRFSHP